MPTNIESRIVSMTFDNGQFEKGVATSQKTLEQLNKQLEFKDADKSFQNLTDAADKVSFSKVLTSAEEMGIKIKASTIAGAEVIKRITNSVIDLGKTITSKVVSPLSGAISQAKNGGWARATNIDQAKFKLSGLGVAWEEISEDINYGVSDTAYGLDEAASAAANLLSAGVEFGDTFGEVGNSPMAKSLRGISGLAAMFNRSYDDLAGLYQVIAAAGGVTNDALSRFRERGIPVAAELAKALHVTEDEVKDLAKNGEISFEQFATAMDNAFGEHAKDANSTFEGAMANMKSALSRIGAEFAEDYRREMIPVYNALRTTFNAVNKQMTEIFSVAEAIMADMSDRFVRYVDAFNKYVIESGALRMVFDGIANVAEGIYNIVGAIVDTILNAFKIITPDLSGLGLSMEQMNQVSENFKKDVFRKPADAFKKMSESFLAMTQNEDFLAKVVHVVETIADIAKTIFSIFRNLLSSVFTIGRILGKAFGAVAEIIGKIYSKITGKSNITFGGLFSGLVNGTAKLSDWLKKLEEWLDTNKIFQKAVDYSGKAIDKFAGWINTAVNKVKELAKAFDAWVQNKTGYTIGDIFDKIKAAVVSFFDSIPDRVKKAGDTLKKWFETFKGWIDIAIAKIKEIANKIDAFVQKATGYTIGQHFEHIRDNVKEAIEKVKEFFQTFGKSKEAESADEQLSPFLKLWNGIKDVFSGIVDFFKTIWPYISGFFKDIGAGLGQIFSELGTTLKGLGIEDLKDILTGGGAVAGGAGLFIMGSGIAKFVDQLRKTVSGEKGLISNVKGFFSTIKGSVKDTLVEVQRDVKADMILKIAKAVAILAAAIFALSLLKPEKLIIATGALEAVFMGLKSIMGKMSRVTKRLDSDVAIIRMSAALILVSIAAAMLAKAMFKFALLKPENLLQGGIAMAVTIDMFEKLLKRVGKLAQKTNAKDVLSISAAIALMAFAIKLLVRPIKVFGRMDTGVLAQGLFTVVILLNKMSKTFKKMKNVGEYAHQGGKAIASMAFALLLMLIPIKVLGKMDWKQLLKGIAGVSLLMFSMSLSLRLMSKNTKQLEKDGEKTKETSNNLKGVAFTMLAMAAAIRLLTPALEAFSDDKRINLAGVGKMLLAIAGLAAVMGLLNKFGGPKEGSVAVSLIKMSLAFIAMALAMRLLIDPLERMNNVEWGSVLKMIGLMLAFAIAGKVLGPVLKGLGLLLLSFGAVLIAISLSMQLGAIGITMLAGAFALFLPVLKGFSELSWGSIGKAAAILGAMIVALGALGLLFSGKLLKFLQPRDLIKIAMSMLILAGALALVTKVLSTITDIPWGTLGKAGLVLVAIVAALAALAFLPLAGLGDSLLKISLSIMIVVGGLLVLGVVLSFIAVKFKDTLSQGLQALTELMPQFFGWLDALISGLLNSLLAALPQLFLLVTVAINGLLQILIDIGPRLVEVLEGFIPYVLQGILIVLIALSEKAYDITLALVDILVNVICGVFDGLSNRMSDIMDSMFHFLETLVTEFFEGLWEECKKLWDWLRDEAWPWLQDRGPEILSDIWDGITAGLKWVKDKIVGAGKKLWGWLTGKDDEVEENAYEGAYQIGSQINDGFRESLDINSPSGVGEEGGKYFGEGVLNGLTGILDSIKGGGSDMGGSIVDGFKEKLNGTGGLMDVFSGGGSDLGGSLLGGFGDTLTGANGGEGITDVIQNALNGAGEGGFEIPITPVVNMDNPQVTGGDDLQWYSDLNGTPVDAGTDIYSQITADNADMIASQESNNHLTEQTLSELQGMREDNLTSSEATTSSIDTMTTKLENLQTEMLRKLNDMSSGQAENIRVTNTKIADIRSDLSYLASSINKLKLVLDTGAVAGELTPKIDERLGKLAAYKGRGIS